MVKPAIKILLVVVEFKISELKYAVVKSYC